MQRVFFFICYILVFNSWSQRPIYDYVSFNRTLKVPSELNSERSAVIFSVPNKVTDGIKAVGDYEKMLNQVHKGLRTMGVDAILYLNDIHLNASQSAKESYIELFNRRRVTNIIFITQLSDGYEYIMAPFSGTSRMIKDGSDAFYLKANDLYTLLLNVGKEVRRADQPINNFLIPEKPNYIEGLSIVEKTLLKNYPGILRRSELAVERFIPLDTVGIADQEVLNRIRAYNSSIERKNMELEQLMSGYPYKYVMIDPMTDDELKRNRYQFLLRSVCASAKTVKQMLDYEVLPSETAFVSIIPVMPDQTKVKTIPKDGLVCKFYVRQNISKNVHVGEWDADVTWQDALNNMIGNLIQEHNVGN
ncbi:hypothetical protein [Ekhidna sp.]|uniref:hypothetical protein n=1 Tax=Ekhidna sp. TaxID=2608089 RepID=UPI003CCB83B2